MSFKVWSRLLNAMLIGCCAMPVSQALAGDGDRLVATAVQDEARKLPEDNTAFFSRADRKVRFQLVKFSGDTTDMLAGTKVTVIDPNGVESTLKADATGVATLDDAMPGLHALVVAGENGHTAVPIAFREGDVAAVAANEAVGSVAQAPVVKLPLMNIDPRELVRLTSSYLPPDMGGSYEDIDSDFVTSGEMTQGLQYRVRLGDEGTLDGRVYSLVRDGLTSSGVEGTNILIYRGNVLVARAVVDQFGKFSIADMSPGVYGLVGVGPAGYAAFGFEAFNAATIAQTSDGLTLVSTAAVASGSVMPVVLVPPSMVPAVLQQIRDASPPPTDDLTTAPGVGSPAAAGAGAGAGPGSAGAAGAGGGFGGGAAAGGIGGAGGLLGLAAIGGIAAAAAGSNDDNNNFVPPPATNGGL